jgi:hypothetical protein
MINQLSPAIATAPQFLLVSIYAMGPRPLIIGIIGCALLGAVRALHLRGGRRAFVVVRGGEDCPPDKMRNILGLPFHPCDAGAASWLVSSCHTHGLSASFFNQELNPEVLDEIVQGATPDDLVVVVTTPRPRFLDEVTHTRLSG